MAEKKTYKVEGRWRGKSAGGCYNHPTWRFNPQLFVSSAKEDKVIKICLTYISDEKKKKKNIGFYVAKVDDATRRILILSKDRLVAKTPFSATKSVELEFTAKAGDMYVIVPCTFKPDIEGQFQISFTCIPPLKVQPLAITGEWKCVTAKGQWKGRTAGGCRNHPSCMDNPQFLIKTKKSTSCTILLTQTEIEEFDPIGYYVLTTKASSHKATKFRGDNVIGKSDFSRGKESCGEFKLEAKSKYIIIPCTFEPGKESSFAISVFSEQPVKLKELKDARVVTEESAWEGQQAGGSAEHTTWRNNPQYILLIQSNATIQISLEQLRKELEPIMFYVMRSDGQRCILYKQDDVIVKTEAKKERIVSSEVKLEKNEKPYILVPATQDPGKGGKFRLTITVVSTELSHKSSSNSSLLKASNVLQFLPCNFEWSRKHYKGRWVGTFRGGNLSNASSWLHNPQFNLNLANDSKLILIISQPNQEREMFLYVVKASKPQVLTSAATEDIVSQSTVKTSGKEVSLECSLPTGSYNIVCALQNPEQDGEFELAVHSSTDNFALEPVGNDLSWVKTKIRRSVPTSDGGQQVIKWEDIKLMGKLGQGGFGVVYKGDWNGRIVAVKKINCDEMPDNELEALQQEVNIMRNLKHPNVLELLGANMDGNAFMITEFMSRGNVSDVLTDPNVDFKRILQMALDVANGMKYLHSQTPIIVHRDLKSLNLLVSEDYRVKVADFGLSKATQENSLNTKVGSLNWCAPEILLKRACYTKKSDVYSYGMVLYELAAREPPFKGLNPLQVVRAIDSGEMPELPAEFDEDFKILVEDCWKEEPEDRPDFDEIIPRLEEILKKI